MSPTIPSIVSHIGETYVAQVFGDLMQAGLVGHLSSTHLGRGNSSPLFSKAQAKLFFPLPKHHLFPAKQLPRFWGGCGLAAFLQNVMFPWQWGSVTLSSLQKDGTEAGRGNKGAEQHPLHR